MQVPPAQHAPGPHDETQVPVELQQGQSGLRGEAQVPSAASSGAAARSSDVEAPSYPTGTTGFAPVPLEALPFPAIVVASSNDEYVTLARAEQFARAWHARFVDAGPLGHINSTSGLGEWAMGQRLLDELLAG